MPIGTSRLSLLTFPQSWDGDSIVLRFLCLPRRQPDIPLGPGLPDFAHADLVFSARLVSGLDHLPTQAVSIEKGPLVLDSRPLNKAALFDELRNQFDIKPRVAVARPKPSFLKAATDSYDQIAGTQRRSQFLRASCDYACALNDGGPHDPNEQPPVLETSLTWGRVIAYALRQPALAETLGLVGQAKVRPDDAFFDSGGWLFVDLHASSAGAGVAGLAARYAARIPPLSANHARTIFAAVLFPVDHVITADDVFREAEIYDDGLAKQVHGAQIVNRIANPRIRQRGDAIQLGWDDEQIAIWLNRQADIGPDKELIVDAPGGVAGYRIDVRRRGEKPWHSLLRVESPEALMLGPHSLGTFAGEGVVETIPAQSAKATHGDFWLPPYFAAWRGGSLALSDSTLLAIQNEAESRIPTSQPESLLAREKTFVPVGDTDVPLRYGWSYEFRVRLADLTRGGPDWHVVQPDAPETGVLSVDFKRRSKPGPLNRRLAGVPARTLRLEKPRLGYPEALFAGADLADIIDDVNTIAASYDAATATVTIPRDAGVFDPDVVAIEIDVFVRALNNDAAEFMPLYSTRRDMPDSILELTLDFQDVAMLAAFDSDQPGDGPLALPTAREVRLTLTPLGKDDEAYFYDQDARRGDPIDVDVRAEAATEDDLLVESPLPATTLQSFFFQPSADPDAAPPCERLGVELGLDHAGMTLSGRSVHRSVIGCSAAFRHTLSPECASLTFGSSSDLFSRWINAVRFTVSRDWTWDGLADAGITIKRIVTRHGGTPKTTEVVVGTMQLPRALAAKSRPDGAPSCRSAGRQATEILFFDAFDPKPEGADFPAELTIEYVLDPAFVKAPPPPASTCSIELPVTTPPSQVPKIAGAGIALSPYEKADNYSSSEPRERMLWIEFEEAPRDPGDEYFVRVVGYAPDPLLLQLDHPLGDAVEPPLPIDPESMRKITPGQPHDDNGLNAMSGVSASPRADSTRHYLVPLPDGLGAESPELFGFFVYEVRLGHTAGRWSTAQGRFGPALRVAGVQHPAPTLACHVRRGDDSVRVMAPFAAAVRDGRHLGPRSPRTQLWSLLYARVRQVDATSWRNVLIAQQRLFHDDNHLPGNGEVFGAGEFPIAAVRDSLGRLGLPADAPLTALAAEVFGEPTRESPLGAELGHARLLRISPLVSVPDAC